MLGWWIIISSQTPQERDNAVDKSAILATWEASVGGKEWIDALVRDGKATQLLFDGYPCRFIAAAKHIFPLIQHGPPQHTAPVVIGDDYVSEGGWSAKATIHRDRMAACPEEKTLTIDAWDQS
ncbi:hypothetical protein [Rhodanobacter umsongensis]